MSISSKDVQYIAALARIHIPPEKLDMFCAELGGILKYVEQLQKLNLDDVKPTSHAVPLTDAKRSDIVRPSLDHQEALKISVDQKDGCFKVPLVIE